MGGALASRGSVSGDKFLLNSGVELTGKGSLTSSLGGTIQLGRNVPKKFMKQGPVSGIAWHVLFVTVLDFLDC